MSKKFLKRVHKYAVYYGREALKDLMEFDLVILEPSHYKEEDIRFLQEQKTMVLAYVSVMEVGTFHQLFSALEHTDLLLLNGQPMIQEDYGTYLLDLTSQHWKSILLHHIGLLLTKSKYDGIFLDTIGDVERTDLPNAWTQMDAAAKFAQDLRRWFPAATLIQNNGLEGLCLRTAPYVDGIVWENPPLERKESAQWISLVAERLKQLESEHELIPFLLFDGIDKFERKEIILRRRFADAHQFRMYMAETNFQGRVRRPERDS